MIADSWLTDWLAVWAMLCVQTSVREGIGNGNGSSSRRQWGKDEKGERSLGVCVWGYFVKEKEKSTGFKSCNQNGRHATKKICWTKPEPMCYLMLMSKSSECMPVWPHTLTNQLTDHNCSSSSKSSSSSPNCASVHCANLHYKVEKNSRTK